MSSIVILLALIIPVVVTISAVQSSVNVIEGDTVDFCVRIDGIPPFGGLEVDVVVAIEGEGVDNITGKTYSFMKL